MTLLSHLHRRAAAEAAAGIVFRQWLVGRGGAGAAEDREAIAKVRAFLEAHGDSRFEPMEADENTPRVFNRAGFWRSANGGREFLCLSEAWRNEICAGMDASRVARVLANRGVLLKDSEGKNSITVALPSGLGRTRCYVVTSGIFGDSEDA